MSAPIFESSTEDIPAVKIVIAIPARIGSTRLPRKPLVPLGGMPLIKHVASRVAECISELSNQLSIPDSEITSCVATDSPDVQNALSSSGIMTIMTSAALASGTDRIQAALESLEKTRLKLSASTLVINLQGDEPFFCVNDIVNLIKGMQNEPHCPMGTLAFSQSSVQSFLRTSTVKVTRNNLGQALYFSRAPIAWPRETWGASGLIYDLSDKMKTSAPISFLQHVGIYAYRWSSLKQFTSMPQSSLELREGLEQLRALEAGWAIKVVDAQEAPFGIDTAEDLLRAEAHLIQNKGKRS